MSPRTPRLVAATLVATVLLAVGMAVGRASAPDVSPDTTAVEELDRVDHTTAAPGPPGRPLPLGGPYPRTPAGAVTAAAAYVVAFDGPALLDPNQRDERVERVAASQAREDLADLFARLAAMLESRLGVGAGTTSDPGFVWRSVPAGWQLREFSARDAVVAIWGTSVLVMAGRQIDQPGWETTEVSLRWERGDWRLVGFRSVDGPTPPWAGSQTAAAVGREINGFEGFVYLPAGVDR